MFFKNKKKIQQLEAAVHNQNCTIDRLAEELDQAHARIDSTIQKTTDLLCNMGEILYDLQLRCIIEDNLEHGYFFDLNMESETNDFRLLFVAFDTMYDESTMVYRAIQKFSWEEIQEKGYKVSIEYSLDNGQLLLRVDVHDTKEIKYSKFYRLLYNNVFSVGDRVYELDLEEFEFLIDVSPSINLKYISKYQILDPIRIYKDCKSLGQ